MCGEKKTRPLGSLLLGFFVTARIVCARIARECAQPTGLQNSKKWGVVVSPHGTSFAFSVLSANFTKSKGEDALLTSTCVTEVHRPSRRRRALQTRRRR